MNRVLRRCLTLAVLLLVAGAAQAAPPFYVGVEEANHEFSRITAADMEVIRSKHVLMASRSFGLCILSGISSLASSNPMYALNRSPSYDVNNFGPDVLPLNAFETYDFVHYLCTLNPQLTTRLPEMDGFVRNRYFEQLDAIMVEYHLSDPSAFPAYQATLDAIRADFPHIKVIYVTSGYFIDTTANHAANQASAAFGALSRAAYKGVQPLYDMASLLGTDSAGVWQGDFLCPEFNLFYPNGDNTHPNTPFATERLGKAMLVMLYKMYCELPLRANAGPDQFVVDTDSDGSCTVTLDGSESYCQQGELVSYVWKEGSTVVATGETAQVSLPYGTHTINLVVTDDSANTDRDDVQIVAKASSIHVVYQIAASADDTQFTETSNSVTSTTLMWPYNYGLRRSGMRWAVNIPPGSTILEAKISGCSNGQQDIQKSPTLQMNLFVKDESCAAFSSNPWSWAVSANSITWIMERSTWLEGQWYDSPDISSLVQEFIDRPGYTPGNYLGLRGMGARPTGEIGWRYIYQWDYGDHTRGAKLDILYAEPEPNHAPVANAGPDQLVHDATRAGSVAVTLTGAASSDDDGTISSYVWKEGATQIATGQTAQVTLSTGVHGITLVVTDNEGATDDDTVSVTVNAKPVAHAGTDQTVAADITGYAMVTVTGSASSDSDGNLVDWRWDDGPTFLGDSGVAVRQFSLAVGVHTITLTVADNLALTDVDTVVVTVEAPVQPDLEISAEWAAGQNWVYQNTPTSRALPGGGHQSALTVRIDSGDFPDQDYTITFAQGGKEITDDSGNFIVAAASTPITPGTPEVVAVFGGLRTASTPSPAEGGVYTPYTLNVTVTGSPAPQEATVPVSLVLRNLGDVNNDGVVTAEDKGEINKSLNGLDAPHGVGLRDLDLTGDGTVVNAEDKAIINLILNGLEP